MQIKIICLIFFYSKRHTILNNKITSLINYCSKTHLTKEKQKKPLNNKIETKINKIIYSSIVQLRYNTSAKNNYIVHEPIYLK